MGYAAISIYMCFTDENGHTTMGSTLLGFKKRYALDNLFHKWNEINDCLPCNNLALSQTV